MSDHMPPTLELEKRTEIMPPGIISVSIKGSWSALNFRSMLIAFESLYLLEYNLNNELNNILATNYGIAPKDITTYLEAIQLPEFFLKKSEILSFSKSECFELNTLSVNGLLKAQNAVLKVKLIKYSSPGKVDLLGIGEVMKSIFSLMKYYFPNRAEKLKNLNLSEDILKKKIENWKSIGLNDEEVKKLAYLHFGNIFYLEGLREKPFGDMAQITNLEYLEASIEKQE